MKEIADALSEMIAAVKPLGSERLSIHDALGRVASQNIIAKRALPPFDQSAMDGYALTGRECTKSGAILQVVGEIPAGTEPSFTLAAGQCARIFTGARVPAGADSVLIQENTRREGDTITSLCAVKTGANIRFAGSDMQLGDIVVDQGRIIGPAEFATLLSQKNLYVQVHRKPSLRILTSGNELRSADSDEPDIIVDSNSWMIRALAEQDGASASLAEVASDDDASLRAKLVDVDTDLIVTIGGASVGDHDRVASTLRGLGAQQHFAKIRVKPGKPVHLWTLNGKALIALPGNPASAWATYHLFVRPLIRKLSGETLCFDALHEVIIEDTNYRSGGRPELARASVRYVDGEIRARILSTQSSGSFSSFNQSNAFVCLRPHQEVSNENRVSALLLSPLRTQDFDDRAFRA